MVRLRFKFLPMVDRRCSLSKKDSQYLGIGGCFLLVQEFQIKVILSAACWSSLVPLIFVRHMLL